MIRFIIKLGVYFIIVMGLLIIYAGISGIWKGADSARWPIATGNIIVSKVVYRSADLGAGWRHEKYSEILYSYDVNGVAYENSTVTYDGSYSDFGDSLSREFPVGKVVRVFYDPDKPKESVLFPGSRSMGQVAGMILMGLCFTIIGTYGAWALKSGSDI